MGREGVFVRYPLISRVFAWILLPIFMGFFILYLVMTSSVGSVDGDVKVTGLQSDTKIVRDNHGVPYILADSEIDAYFALGFAHSQDRLWQMDMSRRIGAGRISESLGEKFVQVDVTMRTLGFYDHAESMWDELPQRDKQILEAYSAGINAQIDALEVFPAEYGLYQIAPEKWTPKDSLIVMQKFAWDMATNINSEIKRTLLLQTVGEDKAKLLIKAPQSDISQIAAIVPDINETLPQLVAEHNLSSKQFVGSNAWVVSGKYSASGSPLLAADPHLETIIPSTWYIANIQAAGMELSGATIPGLPFIIMGRNKDIAWSITNMHADTQDIFIEKINPVNRNQYVRDGKFYDMTLKNEEIHIKRPFVNDSPPMKVVVRRTLNGPVMSDYANQLQDFVYSVGWTGDRLSAKSFSSFLNVNRATDWVSFNEAMSEHVAPVFNFLYADNKGNIGHLAPGYFPIRGDGQFGDLPVAGWDSRFGWNGQVPFSEVPRALNPTAGYIVTANQKVVTDDYPYHLSSDFQSADRAKRISAEIERLIKETGSKLTMNDMQALQGDIYSPSVEALLPHLKAVQVTDEDKENIDTLAEALEIVKNWDGDMSMESQGATIYMSWLAYVNTLILSDEFQVSAFNPSSAVLLNQMLNEANYEFLATMLNTPNHEWCDFRDSDKVESCVDIANQAFLLAVRELEDRNDSDSNEWTWGDSHEIDYTHFPFSGGEEAIDVAGMLLFDRSAASAGNGDSVNVAPASFHPDAKFVQQYAASYRQVLEVKADGESKMIVNTGQSGNPLSPFYDDLIPLFSAMDYLNINKSLFADTQSSESVHVLRLVPAK